MFQPLLQGLGYGMVLCFLIGPIFFALIQTGIERGFRAGAMLGLGIWASDVLIISFCYWGISSVIRLTEQDGFEKYLGVIGGILLISFGIGTIISRPPDFLAKKAGALVPTQAVKGFWGYLTLWAKGFLINTFNPFTFFFWIGIMTTVVAKNSLSHQHAFLFFTGIISTLVVTDSLKVLLAKVIRRWLRPHHIIWMRRISGAALMAFGLALIVRVIW